MQVEYPQGVTDGPNIINPADDDAYSALFRPEPAVERAPIPFEQAPVDVAAEPEPTPVLEPEFTSPSADTGRLFRSRGADAASGAIAALPANQASHLRTMEAESTQTRQAVAVSATAHATESAVTPTPQVTPTPAPTASPAAPPSADQVFAAPILDVSMPKVSPKASPEMAKSRRTDPGLNPLGVYVIVIGTTLVAGFLDSFISGTGLGWLTGIALIAASVFCALKVRVSDASVAVIAPPLAYGIAAVTVGQLGQSRAGGALISAFVNGFFTLADNWFWVISTTLVALAIVVVRARR